jgi:aspartate aminotransferase
LDIQLSNRVNRIKPSPTLAVTQRAQELKAQGKDVIGLGAGEPDFDTPDHIKQAAKRALDEGKTKYTAVDGTPGLKDAIVKKYAEFHKLKFAPNQVTVSTGGKQCIYNFLQAYIDEGDEVIIPSPYWVSYPDMVLLADGKPVFVEAGIEQDFKITPAQLEAAITPRTKVFFINSPSNPTGIAYTKAELIALSEVLKRHPHVLIATDDMYEHVLWNGDFYNIPMVAPELLDRTIILSGVSKAYSMTGWRIGYAAGPAALIKAMNKIQGQSTSNPCSIAQAAAEAALRGSYDTVNEMVKHFKQRHDFVVDALNKMVGVSCKPADGTFYAFPNIQGAMENMSYESDIQLAEYLLDKVGVAVVPGSAFGANGYMRLSYATSMDNLKESMQRLTKAFNAA